ncbi:ribulose-phosphate 3-epimerase [Blastocladiella britannica]|nr:ribulose-phosphate 3-epimerase [Blastocladiella britannica]
MPKAIICPSLLSGDWAFLARDCNDMLARGADYLHMGKKNPLYFIPFFLSLTPPYYDNTIRVYIDVMDGHFVPNLTIGAPVIKSLRKHTKGFLDCHLMVSNPEQWVDDYAAAGANGFTFHVEATENSVALIHRILALNMLPGIAVKPGTPVASLYPIIDAVGVDKMGLALVMTVEPGFGGQSFMRDQMAKVKALRNRYPTLNIQVDGGLALDTIEAAAEAGANVIVAGSAVFGAVDPTAVIAGLRAAVDKKRN